MNKVLNWTFGSLFRTIGRLFGFLIVCLLLLIIGSKLGFKLPDFLMPMYINASVINETDWANNKNQFSKFQFYDCTSSSCTTQDAITGEYSVNTTSGNIFYLSANEDRFTIASNGVGVANWLGTLKKDYLYSYTAYYCSGSTFANSSTNKSIYTSSSGSVLGKNALSPIYQSHNWTTMSNKPGSETGSLVPANCYAVTSLFVPSADSTWVSQHFTASSSSISDVRIFPVVWTLSELGIYTTAVKDIIDESGFATAESVEQVQDSVNDVKQEIQDTNDNIMSDEEPDVSDMTNLAGYLPPGPLDSVLNLPLSILNSLNNKLSSNCTPLSLNLPFVNYSLDIPCLSTIFNQINGLNTLFEFIGVICGALIMYSYLTYLYNWVDDVTSLRHNKARLFGAKSDVDNWGGV